MSATTIRKQNTTTNWETVKLVGFDTETTGVDPLSDHIVTAAFYLHTTNTSSNTLINPGVPIPDEAARVHGITTATAQADGISPVAGLTWIRDMLTWAWDDGCVIVGHNIAYDLTIVNTNLARHGLGTLTIAGPVLDTLVVDKHVDKWRKGKRTLTAMSDHYNVVLDDAHNADADAKAAVLIAAAIADAKLGRYSPDYLHTKQVDWAAEQAASLQEYFRRTRPDAVVDGTWPLRGAA